MGFLLSISLLKIKAFRSHPILGLFSSFFQAKKNLVLSIDKFIQERIVLAGVAISETYARTKINDGDVILTYAWFVHSAFCLAELST